MRLIPSSHQELLALTRNQCTVSLASRWTVVLSRPSPQSIVSEVSNTVFCRSSLYASVSVRHWTVYSVALTTASKHTATRPSQAVTSMFPGTPERRRRAGGRIRPAALTARVGRLHPQRIGGSVDQPGHRRGVHRHRQLPLGIELLSPRFPLHGVLRRDRHRVPSHRQVGVARRHLQRFSGVSGAGTCGMPVAGSDHSLSPWALPALTRNV